MTNAEKKVKELLSDASWCKYGCGPISNHVIESKGKIIGAGSTKANAWRDALSKLKIKD